MIVGVGISDAFALRDNVLQHLWGKFTFVGKFVIAEKVTAL
jgi:hypothetical protein